MRNNVHSDIFWYGDMILPVWAKNQKISKIHIQYIWKICEGMTSSTRSFEYS